MDIQKHLEKAQEASRRRNFAYAIQLYHQILTLKPDQGEARAGLREAIVKRSEMRRVPGAIAALLGAPARLAGALYTLLRKPLRAAAAYERYLVHDPLSAKVNFSLGRALEQAGCMRSAAEVYRFLAEARPKDVEALKAAGRALYRSEEHREALEFYERALALAPRDQEAGKMRKNLAAEGALRETRYETAESSLELVKDKEQARKLETSARIHRSREEIEEAVAALEKETAENPDDVGRMEELARLYLKAGRPGDSLELLKRALEIDPERPGLRDAAGTAEIALLDARIQEARSDSSRAEEVKGLERRRLEVEVAEYERRAREHPTDMEIRFRLGRAYLAAARLDEAVGEFQQSVKDPRRRLDSLVLLGQCFYRKGLYDFAAKQLEKAFEIVGSTSGRGKEIAYNLGLIAEKQGHSEEALGWFGRVYEVDIQYRDVARKIEALKLEPGP